MLFRTAAFALGCLASLQAVAQCYTVYDRDNRVLYHASESPVDLSKPLHETVPGVFPGGHMVFDNFSSCNDLRPLTPPVLAPPQLERMGAGPANPRPEKVITELRNPPLRITREGDHLLIEGIGAHRAMQAQ